MNKKFKVFILVLIIAGSFFAGYWANRGSGSDDAAVRKILYYVDPMNPGFRSEKPGIAPCGMPLEPVYAEPGDGGAAGMAEQKALPPGAIRISSDKQQLIGVKVATVEKAPWSHSLRVLGRVAPDETLVYRINTATDSWVEKALPVTTGSLVRKGELLATLSFFSLEYRTLVQNYFNLVALGETSSPGIPNQPVYEQPRSVTEKKPQYSATQLKQMRKATRNVGDITGDSQIDYYRKYLYNYGMSPSQVDEMERTRKFPEVIEIRAPAAGFVLLRNVSPGLRLEKGTELFRIADLSRVWILADIFENEASYFRPGMQVKIELPYQKKTLSARVSSVLPQFDSGSRTLKLRLTAANPGYNMRPDMFVNVELSVSGPAAILVPVDAVLDSGLKKTVFIDRGNGIFEPRQVETGRFLGERVEIVQGLMPGEKIVVSGNFLIDSETRMQQAASGIIGKVVRDPVCGMNTNEDHARTAGHFHQYKGNEYYFCSNECRDEFIKSPERFIKIAADQGSRSSPSIPFSASKTQKSKKDVIMDHHDHAGMHGSPEAAPMPMPGKEKMVKPASNRKAAVPMDEAAITESTTSPLPVSDRTMPMMTESPRSKLSPVAESPMPMMSAPGSGGVSSGTPGAALISPGGSSVQSAMPGIVSPDAEKIKKYSLPIADPSAAAPMPGAAMNGLPSGTPDKATVSGIPAERQSQKTRYPARMRLKAPASGTRMSGREAFPASDENETNAVSNIPPVMDGQMKTVGGE